MSRLNYEINICKSLEFDADGNAICWGEASNENADLDGDITLQQAMIDSKDYFLSSGVVSYDHKHNEPNERNPEHFIIGEPLDVQFTPDKKTRVKFKLFQSNEIAKEIIGKLKDKAKTVRISIGGRFGKKQGNKIVSFLWDEIALTHKPVNNTLLPVQLGNTLSFSKSLKVFNAISHSVQRGDTFEDIQSLIIKRSKGMTKESRKELLGILDEVKKSLPGDDFVPKAEEDDEGDLKVTEEPEADPEADPEEGKEEDDDEIPLTDINDEEMDKEIEKSMGKQIYERIAKFEKSLADFDKKFTQDIELCTSLISGLGRATASIAKSMKKPLARQSVIQKSIVNKETKPQVTKEEVLQKSLKAVKDGRISIYEFSEIESGIQRGNGVSESILKKLDY